MKNTHTGDRFEILYIYIYIYTHTHSEMDNEIHLLYGESS